MPTAAWGAIGYHRSEAKMRLEAKGASAISDEDIKWLLPWADEIAPRLTREQAKELKQEASRRNLQV